jgi:hypothetical protein
MITARCKFVVESMTQYENGERDVNLVTKYDPNADADRAFTKYTPSGSMHVRITNPNVYELFTPGRKVYVDVSVVEEGN